ncbi:MAG: GTP-binding protein, partial [Candidatus Uhrbacteria bacterium]
MLASIAMTVALFVGTVASTQFAPSPSPMEMVPVSEVRALYLTSGIAASDRFEHFLDLLDSTEVNALVIDLKDAN